MLRTKFKGIRPVATSIDLPEMPLAFDHFGKRFILPRYIYCRSPSLTVSTPIRSIGTCGYHTFPMIVQYSNHPRQFESMDSK